MWERKGNVMKKVLLFMLAAVFLCASAALAEVKEFGESFCRYTIDLPASWKAEPAKDAMLFHSTDGKAAIYVAAAQIPNMTQENLAELAQTKAKELGLGTPEKGEDGNYSMSGKKDGIDMLVNISLANGVFVTIVESGDLNATDPVAGSLDFKN